MVNKIHGADGTVVERGTAMRVNASLNPSRTEVASTVVRSEYSLCSSPKDVKYMNYKEIKIKQNPLNTPTRIFSRPANYSIQCAQLVVLSD